MAMPRKLKLMNVFLNGYSYQGVAKSVTLRIFMKGDHSITSIEIG